MRPIIYVSHPFGGDAANVTRAREICKAYARQLPEALFVPALSVTCRPYDPGHYVRDLQLLLELESRCDVVFMTGDWESSLGCQTEYEFATRQGIPIAETYADLLAILTSVEKGELN